jgi:hypothetical protein
MIKEKGFPEHHINTTRTLYTDTVTQTESARKGSETQIIIDQR